MGLRPIYNDKLCSILFRFENILICCLIKQMLEFFFPYIIIYHSNIPVKPKKLYFFWDARITPTAKAGGVLNIIIPGDFAGYYYIFYKKHFLL